MAAPKLKMLTHFSSVVLCKSVGTSACSESMNTQLSRDTTIPSLLNKLSGHNRNNSNVFTDGALRDSNAHILPSMTGSEPAIPEVAKDSRIVEASMCPTVSTLSWRVACALIQTHLRCLRANDTFIFRHTLDVLSDSHMLFCLEPSGLVLVHTVSNSNYIPSLLL